MAEVPAIFLGEPDTDHLLVRIFSRAYPGGLGVLDDNWLHAELAGRAGAGRLRCPAFLRAPDLARLARGLEALAGGTRDTARFEPRDPWVRLELHRSGPSGLAARVHARDDGSERALSFSWELDGDRLERLRREVEAAVVAFPPIPDSTR